MLLEELVNLMSEDQQLSFKQAVVRQTIHYVSKQLPPHDLDEGERTFIALAYQWLEQPTEENAENAQTAAIFDSIDGGARYFDYPTYFLEPAWAAGSSAQYVSRHALVASGTDSQAASQWQLATAWAILHHEEPPLLGNS